VIVRLFAAHRTTTAEPAANAKAPSVAEPTEPVGRIHITSCVMGVLLGRHPYVGIQARRRPHRHKA
jgi:hypothetical protein